MARRQMQLKVVALDKVYGPVAMDKLIQLAAQGRLSPQDQVCNVGTDAWTAVADVPALAAAMPQAAVVGASITGEPLPEPDADASWTSWSSDDDSGEAEMDMAPMIDVTFLLLIFFMLTNSLANPSPMDVPTAVHGRGVNLEGQQLILIDDQGAYFLGDQASEENRAESVDALVAEVESNAAGAGPAMDVILNAHKETDYLLVRELVERLSSAEGLGQVMLGVEERLE